ncbi:MAG: DNA replication/repair protein RecF [Candidatus Latescibacteria bacterium]|nr:DNA replication/repair protein RecF [Candidatus Latescibacterota bacterium]
MRIREITLQPFRNFSELRLQFDADRILIGGANGRGKSNILEAISYLSIGKSVRGAQDVQAVPHNGQYFDIRAVCGDGPHHHQLRLYFGNQEGKRIFCDGTPLPRIADILGIFKTVHFSPEDVALVMRFPAQRRRLLDILISQTSAPYLHDLQQYQRVLAQRNQLLKMSRGTLRESEAQALDAWDRQLARFGARIRFRRLEVLAGMQAAMNRYYALLSGHREKAGLCYEYSASMNNDPAPAEEQLCADLEQELRGRRGSELHLGHTRCGSHRDQLVFTLDGHPADAFASEGQMKTLLISWKLTETQVLAGETGQNPVLLLDDVFSELDSQRSAALMELIGTCEQVVLTSPKRPDGPLGAGFSEIWLDG